MSAAKPVALLLAAGRGSRFSPGGETNKLLARLPNGVNVAVQSARTLLACVPTVIAVVQDANSTLATLLAQEGCTVVPCPDAHLGMGHSLAAGVAASPAASGWLVALADMPYLQIITLHALLQAPLPPLGIIAPGYQGQRGHPVLFGPAHRNALLQLQGDKGARDVLQAHSVTTLPCEDAGCLRDIDQPQDIS